MLISFVFCTPAFAKDVTLNLNNADIRAFIEFVAGFSGKNFLVDNRVKGQVTIVSPTPISEEAAYEVFLSVLEVNGFAAVPSGSVIKVVPRAESKQKALPVISGSKGNGDDAMVTQVLRLQYADSQQLVALIRPLISPNSHLVAYPRGNMLLLTDSSSNIKRIQDILQYLDRKDAVGVQLFKLEHASADRLAQTITTLYQAGGATAGAATAVKAIAHQPGNMLVVVAAPQIINEVAGVIARLDVAPESDSGRLKVIYLKHASAEDTAKVLTELVGGNSAGATAAGATPGQGKALFSGEVKVVADPATNALLITADPSDIAAVEKIISQLDVRRRQVLVEALIVEVKGDVLERFGVEWMGAANNGAGRGITVGTQNYGNLANVGGALAANANAVPPVSMAAALAGAAQTGLTLGVVNNALSVGAMLNAMQQDKDINVLSTPNLLTMDNEEAEIIVGRNVPFLTGSQQTTGGLANPFQTIERKDVGLTLRVKPQISEGDTVRLELYQEISSVDGGTAAEGGITTSKRSIKTVVLANNNQMIVLGGLIQDDNSATVQRVPCVGAIPLLGEPFKYTNNTKVKTNLMVFLRPKVIKTADQIDRITNRKYFDIKGLYETPVEGGTILFPKQEHHMPADMTPTDTLPPGLAKPATPAPAGQ
ncbi:MAG: type II secretion system protein GspD [Zetaproteobacteria bacterium CG1_02_53_45]|nr:MAG: type II secretion system protein GspD [Zetaproteobacteria bacterium CG1_02_53_45]